MNPLHMNSLPSTSTFIPRPPSTFKPISPQQVTTPDTKNQNTESSPNSSLPCGQQTPTSSTNTSDPPSQDTPPQPFVHSQPQPFTPTQTHHQDPINHKTYNIHLLRPTLTRLPSLPFQMKKLNVYPGQQMVIK